MSTSTSKFDSVIVEGPTTQPQPNNYPRKAPSILINFEGEGNKSLNNNNSRGSTEDQISPVIDVDNEINIVCGSSQRLVNNPSHNGCDSNKKEDNASLNETEKDKRFVKKCGRLNFKLINVEDRGERYVGDFFTTLVDIKWRWTLMYFTCSYVLTWIGFTVFWWVIVRGHGDMDHFEEEGWNPCVAGVKSVSSIFLFSLETQHTIGYGYHRITDECLEGIVLLVVQSIIGVIIEALTVGVFIVKLSRSKKRSQTIVFSKRAVICKTDEGLELQFRVADVGKSILLESHLRAQFITKVVTKSGKVSLTQQNLTLEGDDHDEDRIFLFWPTTIHHKIDEDSPLYSMDFNNFQTSATKGSKVFELIVVLEGIVESTGMTTQARTSYLMSEILWGHQFQQLIREGRKTPLADMELFHETFPMPLAETDMPTCSAKELEERDKKDGEVEETQEH